ncbi:GNAT family N-acetyltransferase [Streptomyces profundus]|nr:GNAT family N-acetyltransferase [Streptomyces sp. MA3_2.13]
MIDHWPLLGLRLDTPRLRLRLPGPEELAELADLAAAGLHDPELMPFSVPWSDLPPAERARSVVQHHWRRLGNWTPDNWQLNLTVFEDGRAVGRQSLWARDFRSLREVATASWVGRAHQGRGIGTEMRAAVLTLAFDGLGAGDAVSGAFQDNPASHRVSTKLGYVADGVERQLVRGRPAVMRRVRLTADRWRTVEHHRATLTGLAPCLPLFGLPAPQRTEPPAG